MNWQTGFRRILLVVSVIAFLIVTAYSYIWYYKDMQDNLSQRIRGLEMDSAIVKDIEAEISRKEPIRLSKIILLDSLKKDIAKKKNKIPPQAYYYNLIPSISLGLLAITSTWIVYYLLNNTIKYIIIPPLAWIKRGFTE